jgi:hypothetical protein
VRVRSNRRIVKTIRRLVWVVMTAITCSACAGRTTASTSGHVASSSCPAGTTGAPRARLLGALGCAKQSGNGTLTVTEVGRSIVMTYQEPASLMTVETQPGAAGPGPIRVIQIGTDNWQSQATGRWDHYTDDPKDFLDGFAAQVRQAAAIAQTGSTFSVPASGADNASLGGAGRPVQITLAANGTLESFSGASVNTDGSTVPFRAVFSQMGSTPPITAPPPDQVDDSRPGGEPLPPGVRAPPTPPVSTPGYRASTP